MHPVLLSAVVAVALLSATAQAQTLVATSNIIVRALDRTLDFTSDTTTSIRDMKVVNTEKEIGRDWKTQYDNWATPAASMELLRWLHETDKHADDPMPPTPTPDGAGLNCNCLPPEHPFRDPSDFRAITRSLIASVPGAKRLKGMLPVGTIVAHKTGTGGTQNGITGATNDIGIITMPNGKHLAIAVFVSDSPADEKTREAVIAKIAKAVWDKWSAGGAN